MSLLLLLKDKPKANFHTDAFDNSTQPQDETPPWFTQPGTATTEVEDTTNLTCTLVTVDSGYSRWQSIDTWNLKDSSVHMEIDGTGLGSDWLNSGNTGAEAGFYFKLNNGAGAEQATLRIDGDVGGPLVEWNRRENAVDNKGTEAYNTTNHRWLRIREASGTIYFERSSDGVSWTVMNGSGSGESHTWTDAELGTGVFNFQTGNGNVTTPGTIVFDNLNIAGVASGLTQRFGMIQI